MAKGFQIGYLGLIYWPKKKYFTIIVDSFIKIMHLVFFYNVRKYKRRCSSTFELYDDIDQPYGLNLWPWGHKLHNFGRGLYDIIAIHLLFFLKWVEFEKMFLKKWLLFYIFCRTHETRGAVRLQLSKLKLLFPGYASN